MPTATQCERANLSITCLEQKIKVINANYGRTDRNTCTNSEINVTNCRAKNSLEIVKQLCDGKHECTVPTTNNVFGDPCGGVYKYLEVEYECVQTTTTTTTVTTTLPLTTQEISTKFHSSFQTTNVIQPVGTSASYEEATARLHHATTETTPPTTPGSTVLIAATAAGVAGALILLILIAALVFWRKKQQKVKALDETSSVEDSHTREEHLNPIYQSDEGVYTMADHSNQSDSGNHYSNSNDVYEAYEVYENMGVAHGNNQSQFANFSTQQDFNQSNSTKISTPRIDAVYSGVTSSGEMKETMHFHKTIVDNPLYGER